MGVMEIIMKKQADSRIFREGQSRGNNHNHTVLGISILASRHIAPNIHIHLGHIVPSAPSTHTHTHTISRSFLRQLRVEHDFIRHQDIPIVPLVVQSRVCFRILGG